MSQTNELRVFISSTFRDLQDEREHLVKKIFPEIRALCRTRGVTFTDIDLRWGITEEEAEREGIIQICLDEIDRCRPFFIGILGERYGWTPPRSDAERVAGKFPALADAISDGSSITEMEIVHGVLANPAMAGHAFFYFRDRDSTRAEFIDTDPEQVSRLRDLKARIRESGFPLRENFKNVTELGELLEQDVRHIVDTEYPESETPNPLELERRAHRAFAASRKRAYIANREYAVAFEDWLAATPPSDEPRSGLPLVISADSGLGKSSLIAHLTDEYRTTHPTAFVIEHYVGASQDGGSATAIMRHVIEEIRERFAIKDKPPEKPDELSRSFPSWLYRAEHFTNKLGIEMLLVIDAVNQLDETGQRLVWLPKSIPAGIRLVVSTTPGTSAEQLAARGWASLEVQPIVNEDARRDIVLRYLGEFHKGITTEQVRHITSDVKASSPLFLRVVAEELRLHGEHETLDAAIDRYAMSADLHDVFDQLLARLERDYGKATVKDILSAIWVSRGGLVETELIGVTGTNRLELSRFLFALDYHLVQRDGLLGFFHDYLRAAVQNRYLRDSSAVRKVREGVGDYFETIPLTLRAVMEMLWQYGGADDATSVRAERLLATLLRIDVLDLLYRAGGLIGEMLRYWGLLSMLGYRAVDEYPRALAIPEKKENTAWALAMAEAIWILTDSSQWKVSAKLGQELVLWCNAHGRKALESWAHRHLSFVTEMLGDYATALAHIDEEELLAYEIGNKIEMASAIHNKGNIYWRQSRRLEAIECLRRSIELWEAIGDRQGVARCMSDMGNVLIDLGRSSEAMEFYNAALAIMEEYGNRVGIASTLANMALIHSRFGRFAESLECSCHAFTTLRELGYRSNAFISKGNMAEVYACQRRYDLALEYFAETLAVHREIGFIWATPFCLNGEARVLLDLAATESSLPAYLPAHLPALSTSAVSGEEWRIEARVLARTKTEECVSISQRLSKNDTLFQGNVTLARIDAAEGNPDLARERLLQMLNSTQDEDERATLNYLLWKLDLASDPAARVTLRVETLRLYRSLYAESPEFEYEQRIEELSATKELS